MNKLKVCFIGIGSIARRHIRNLEAICTERGIGLQIDAVRRDGKCSSIKLINNIYSKVEQVPDDYDVIFITNPTDQHLESLKIYHTKGRNFFIEKPVVSLRQLEDAESFITRDNVIYYVAAPLRYNAVIQWIKKNVDTSNVISVRSISSSYLPAWRPGQDYRESYSAHKDMGGGVSIDLIHEWDYLTYLFGWPEKVQSLIGKKSNLEIDSDDYAIYIAEFNDKIAELHLDYFGRKTIREILLLTKEESIVGDIANNKLHFLASGEEIDFHEERDDYQRRELIHFIDMISGMCEVEDGFHHGVDILKLTQGIIQ
ncbi:Gfo/Idh/MocA family protein [Clostridium sp. Marseille-P3244]|uniref:Gfo/Idh/MocA family protein n=1 Tax=Clostridium sp. Marseille-P3244 TaxID=1871020 RepID=UPI0009306078|nr:Gfo/Idh/MocA family oxidoreductase [Clostridium sp. Marseille-P3244]